MVIHPINAYVWCWSKICHSLDEIPSVTIEWEVVKVQFLMNSNMTLTVLNLHQKTDPKVQQDLKGQGHYNKVKSRSHHDAAHLQPLTNVPTKHQLTFYTGPKKLQTLLNTLHTMIKDKDQFFSLYSSI